MDETNFFSHNSSCVLWKRLEAAWPAGKMFQFNHVSTAPETCERLRAAPPGLDPEVTCQEKHFLLASLPNFRYGVAPLYALEVIVYTTNDLTVIFVAKADSTGLMSGYMKWADYAMSPMTLIASTFIRLLVDAFQRPDKRLVISLFARSAGAYIFPGSEGNRGKHILNDTKLIKWWARVMNIVMDPDQPEHADNIAAEQRLKGADPATSQVFMRVPGCSAAETKKYVPKKLKKTSPFRSVALAADPFKLIARHSAGSDLPARCMVPHFYDDPKTRFADELDGYDRFNSTGNWSSVKTLDEFWDLMQHRQECAAGKLVGFVWGVFTPKGLQEEDLAHGSSSASSIQASAQGLPAEDTASASIAPKSPSKPASPNPKAPKAKSFLSRSLSSHAKSKAKAQQEPENYDDILPEDHPLPQNYAERVVIDSSQYEDIMAILEGGDFTDKRENGEERTIDASVEVLERWADEVCSAADIEQFGYLVFGELQEPVAESSHEQSATEGAKTDQTPAGGKKRRVSDISDPEDSEYRPGKKPSRKARARSVKAEDPVNLLSGGMIRKKPKRAAD
ncbi:MAG: hypothetical protein Q9195_004103 [Heterodermia aff. obscurata]